MSCSEPENSEYAAFAIVKSPSVNGRRAAGAAMPTAMASVARRSRLSYSLDKDDEVEATLAPLLAAHAKKPDALTVRALFQVAVSLEARGDAAAKKGDAKAARDLWEKALASARQASESAANVLPKDDVSLKAYQELVTLIGEKLK